MKIEELPEELREVVDSLKHGSATIECDVKDALDNADNLEDFKERVTTAMNNLISEAGYIKTTLGE